MSDVLGDYTSGYPPNPKYITIKKIINETPRSITKFETFSLSQLKDGQFFKLALY